MGANVNKVASVTLVFWLMKISATTLGETAGDLLSMTLSVGYLASTLLLLAVFVTALIAQLRSLRFNPWLYWTVILATSTAGTTLSDYMDRTLGLGYALGASILAGGLVILLLLWQRVEGSLSVSSITTRRAEIFYWLAILVSNTLGTALGDYLADDSGLGFLGGALLVGAVIATVALAYRLTRINRIALFWIAFVMTRPFGATFGDLLSKPIEGGGLGYGTVGSSLVLALILLALLVLTARSVPAAVIGPTSSAPPPRQS